MAFTSSSEMEGLSGCPTKRIRDMTRHANPQMKKLTKLLVSFMIQSTASREKVEAFPNLLIPICDATATVTPTTMHYSSPQRYISESSALEKPQIPPRMTRKKTRPATRDTMQLYFRNSKTPTSILEHSYLKVSWVSGTPSSSPVDRNIIMKLPTAHPKGRMDSTKLKTSTPVYERGANPSGVEDVRS